MGTSGIVVEAATGRQMRGGATAVAGEGEEVLDLFSRRHSATLVGSLGESGVQNGSTKNLSVASAIKGMARTDDFLDAEMGKHDYDWLLTPPGTPVFLSSDSIENQLSSTGTKNQSIVRSVSTSRASRLSVSSQSENGHPARPIRSSSAIRSSISLSNHRTSALNSSTVSVTSRPTTPSRPSTPRNRSGSVPPPKPSSAPRPVQPRSTNPFKTRPSLTSPAEKTRPSQNSRPSTPNGRPQPPSISITNTNSSTIRSISRPSTPTRQSNTPGISSSTATVSGRSPSAGRLPASRNSVPCSRPSSPGIRPRAPVTPIDIPDFPNDTPPNLRTKLPERSSSAGRTRPGMALIGRANSNADAMAPPGPGWRHSLPVVARSKLPENSMKGRSAKHDRDTALLEIQKPLAPDPGVRRAAKAGLSESTGFGRTMSKMSLDMALRHMDIRQSMGGIRANSIFPHSIRSGNAPKSRPARGSEPILPVTKNEPLPETRSVNKPLLQNGDVAAQHANKDYCLVAKASDFDPYGSSRYDAMLLKEDSNSMNWLHSVEDKSDQSPVFDHRFEPPPEPFGPL